MDMSAGDPDVVGSDTESTSETKSESVESSLQLHQPEDLRCLQCFITFSDWKAKQRHTRNSHRDQYSQQLQQANIAFACYKCDRGFSSSHELSQHQASHRTEEKSFHCLNCQKSFLTYTELIKHKRSECIERGCLCKDCGVLLPSPSRLRSHRITVHLHNPAVANDLSTHQCRKCDWEFQTEEELLQHQDLNCNRMPKDKTPVPKDAVKGLSDSEKIIQEKDETGCKQYDDSPVGDPSDELKPELKIPCSEADCDLIFPSVAALQAHKRDQHGPLSHNSHAYSECNKSYTYHTRLRSHRATFHPQNPAVANDLNTHQCCKCDWEFQTEEELLQHQDLNCNGMPKDKKRVHVSMDAVQRMSNSKKIKQEEDATGYEGYNDSPVPGPSDEVKPELKIPCSKAGCDLTFPSIAALRAHKRDQHGPLSRKTHVYGECNEKYTNPSQLHSHRLTVHPHNPAVANDLSTHQCCKCDWEFQTEEELLQHQDLNCNGMPKDKKLVPDDAVRGLSDSKKIKQEKDETGCKQYDDSPVGDPSDELKPELKIPCSEADCDLIFPSVAALQAHKRDQHGPLSRKTHAYGECHEKYTNPKQLKRHLVRAHRSGHISPTWGKVTRTATEWK